MLNAISVSAGRGIRATQQLPARIASAALLLLAACGGVEEYPQTTFAPRSNFAEEIDNLFWLTLVLGSVVGILVTLALAYILYRYRYRPGSPEPEQVHGNTKLELAWTLIPAVLIAIIAVPTVQTIFATQPEPPADALEIDVVGWQWWWEFRYPVNGGQDTVFTANEVHIPVGRPVSLRLRGGDVVHNFWVPQMGGKRYAIPNRVNSIIFTATEPGEYLGQCAEFCGASHALMKMRLIAHTPEDFAEWLREEAEPAVDPATLPAVAPADSAVLIGKRLVTQGTCVACHIIEGTDAQIGRLGPNLTHFARRRTLAAGILENNAENLAAWIRNPQAIKPAALMPALGLREDELGYIVAYLQTLY